MADLDPTCEAGGCYMFAPGTEERTACERACYLGSASAALAPYNEKALARIKTNRAKANIDTNRAKRR